MFYGVLVGWKYFYVLLCYLCEILNMWVCVVMCKNLDCMFCGVNICNIYVFEKLIFYL